MYSHGVICEFLPVGNHYAPLSFEMNGGMIFISSYHPFSPSQVGTDGNERKKMDRRIEGSNPGNKPSSAS